MPNMDKNIIKQVSAALLFSSRFFLDFCIVFFPHSFLTLPKPPPGFSVLVGFNNLCYVYAKSSRNLSDCLRSQIYACRSAECSAGTPAATRSFVLLQALAFASSYFVLSIFNLIPPFKINHLIYKYKLAHSFDLVNTSFSIF